MKYPPENKEWQKDKKILHSNQEKIIGNWVLDRYPHFSKYVRSVAQHSCHIQP